MPDTLKVGDLCLFRGRTVRIARELGEDYVQVEAVKDGCTLVAARRELEPTE